MNFNELYKKIADLDQPVSEQKVDECGEMPSMQSSMDQPSVSVNLNARGLDNIEHLMALFTKVNPDMMPKGDAPMPKMVDPAAHMSSLKQKLFGDGEEMDAEEDAAGGFDSASTAPDEKVADFTAAIPAGDDFHKEKKMYPRAQPGDNPRAIESLVDKIKEQLLADLQSHKNQ